MVQLAEVILHFLDISTDFMSNLMIAAVSWWRNASTVANGDLSFCRPAAHSRVNASVSVPVQSYRSEGSQALCLVNPWERPHSVLLSENRNTDSIGKTARAGGERKEHESHISGRFTAGIQWWGTPEKSGQRNTGRMRCRDKWNWMKWK